MSLVDNVPGPVVEEEEPSPPGLLDVFKDKGIVGGLKQISPYLIPGVASGEQFAQKATDGVSVQDVFSSLGDFGQEVAYGLPVAGDALAVRDYRRMPEGVDWLTKGLNILGLVGAGVTVGGVSTAGILGALPARVPAMARHTASAPIVPVAYSRNDQLSLFAIDMTEPLVADGLIATTNRTQKQIMIAVSESKLTSAGFDSRAAFSRIRQAITGTERRNGRWVGGKKKNAGQVDSFLSGLGDLLVSQVDDYAKSVGDLTPDQVRVQAVANETSKFDWLINRSKDGLTVDPELGDVAGSWNRMKVGEVLDEAAQVELGAAIVKMADWTAGNLHPEFAFNDPRIWVTGMHLGAGGGEIKLGLIDMDGVPREQLTQDDVLARLSLMASGNRSQLLPHMLVNLQDAWDALVAPNMEELGFAVQRAVKTHPALRVHDNVRMVKTDELTSLRTKEATEFGDLTASIRREGIEEPLIVEYNPTNGAARLVDGHRRLDAAVGNGLEAVPILLKVNRGLEKKGSGNLGTKTLQQLKARGRTPDSLRPQQGDLFSAVPAVYQGIIPEPHRNYGATHNWYRIARGDITEQAKLHGLNEERLIGVASYLSAGEQWETNIEKSVVAALFAKNNPDYTASDLQSHVIAAGHKISEDEAINVRALSHIADKDLAEYFGDDLTSLTILKQANFVEGIIRSTAEDIHLQAKAAYGMYTGLIDDTDLPRVAGRLYGELDRLAPVVIDRHAHAMVYGFSMAPTGTLDNKLYRTAARAFEQMAVALGPVTLPDGTRRMLAPGEVQALLWVAWREARGVTKGYKYYTPEAGKLISAPNLWEPGVGPKFIMNDRLLRLAMDPLPEHMAFRNLPPSDKGVPMTADEAIGRFISVDEYGKRSNQGTALRPERAVMKIGPEGTHIEIPDRIHNGGVARGTYPSLAGSDQGQQMLHQKPMSTHSVVGVETTIQRNTIGGPPIMRRKIEQGHKAWAFEPGRTLVISGSSNEHHKLLSQELFESGIQHKTHTEQPHQLIGEDGEHLRTSQVLKFDDAHELARAWEVLEGPAPKGDGRLVDFIYKEKPDLVAYVNGDMEAPTGAVKAFENHYVDGSGTRLEHLATNGDMSHANSTPVWVSEAGSWETVGAQDTSVGSHRFDYNKDSGVLTWDGVAQIVNPEIIGGPDKLTALASKEVKSLFATGKDLKIRGASVKEVTVMIPPEGTGSVQMFFGEVGDQALPAGWDPSRTIRLSRPNPHKVTAHMPQFGEANQFNSALATDLVQFMNRTGMYRFGYTDKSKVKAGRKLYLPEFEVGT